MFLHLQIKMNNNSLFMRLHNLLYPYLQTFWSGLANFIPLWNYDHENFIEDLIWSPIRKRAPELRHRDKHIVYIGLKAFHLLEILPHY